MEQGNDDRGMKNITRNVIDVILKYRHQRNKENVVILVNYISFIEEKKLILTEFSGFFV